MLSTILRARAQKKIPLARPFSTMEEVDPTPQIKPRTLKATPEAGFKQPRLREDEEVVSFRPTGHTSLTAPTKNYNFELKRQNGEKFKVRFIIGLVILSCVPIIMFVKNAEKNFRAADVKKIAEKRRRRLDEEHGIDRDMHKDAFIELDQIYRISEKSEIKKYQEIGKSA